MHIHLVCYLYYNIYIYIHIRRSLSRTPFARPQIQILSKYKVVNGTSHKPLQDTEESKEELDFSCSYC